MAWKPKTWEPVGQQNWKPKTWELDKSGFSEPPADLATAVVKSDEEFNSQVARSVESAGGIQTEIPSMSWPETFARAGYLLPPKDDAWQFPTLDQQPQDPELLADSVDLPAFPGGTVAPLPMPQLQDGPLAGAHGDFGEVAEIPKFTNMEAFEKALVKDPVKFIPLLGSMAKAIQLSEVLAAGKRLESDKYDKPPVIAMVPSGKPTPVAGPFGGAYAVPGMGPKQPEFPDWSPERQKEYDLQVIQQWQDDMASNKELASRFGGQVGQIVGEMPSFMADILLTSGIYAGVKKGAEKVGQKVLKEGAEKAVGKMATKAAGWAAGSIARGTVMSHRTAAEYLERRLPDNVQINDDGSITFTWPSESPFTSLAKAWGDTVIEVASEESGEAMGKAAKGAAGFAAKKLTGTQFGGRVLPKIYAAYQKLHPEIGWAGFVQKVSTKAGYNGVLQEVGEEYLGDALRAVANVDDFGAGQDAGTFDRLAYAMSQDVENTPAMLVSFAVPGVTRAAAGKAGQTLADAVGEASANRRYAKAKKAYDEQVKTNRLRDIANDVVASQAGQPSTEQPIPVVEGVAPETKAKVKTISPEDQDTEYQDVLDRLMQDEAFNTVWTNDHTDALTDEPPTYSTLAGAAAKAGIDIQPILKELGYQVEQASEGKVSKNAPDSAKAESKLQQNDVKPIQAELKPVEPSLNQSEPVEPSLTQSKPVKQTPQERDLNALPGLGEEVAETERVGLQKAIDETPQSRDLHEVDTLPKVNKDMLQQWLKGDKKRYEVLKGEYDRLTQRIEPGQYIDAHDKERIESERSIIEGDLSDLMSKYHRWGIDENTGRQKTKPVATEKPQAPVERKPFKPLTQDERNQVVEDIANNGSVDIGGYRLSLVERDDTWVVHYESPEEGSAPMDYIVYSKKRKDAVDAAADLIDERLLGPEQAPASQKPEGDIIITEPRTGRTERLPKEPKAKPKLEDANEVTMPIPGDIGYIRIKKSPVGWEVSGSIKRGGGSLTYPPSGPYKTPTEAFDAGKRMIRGNVPGLVIEQMDAKFREAWGLGEKTLAETPVSEPETPTAVEPEQPSVEEKLEPQAPKAVESTQEPTNEPGAEQLRDGRDRAGSAEAPAETPAEPASVSPEPEQGGAVRSGGTRTGGSVSRKGQRGGKTVRGNKGSDTGDVDQSSRRRSTSRRRSNAGGQLDYRITDADDIEAGGARTKYKANIEAIRTLKKIEDEGRLATAEEQAILVKYTGWGGLKNAFEGWQKGWENSQAELHELLTDEEYASARRSTPNAHYTSPAVVRGIWAGLEKLGFKGGRINEPAIGTGIFYGLIPDAIAADSRLFGVELDSISSRIAKQLYQSASIENRGFQDVRYPDNFFDLFVSNVPFDEKTHPHDPDMPRGMNFNLHDFYFAKALKKTRPGGLVAFITSKGTLDKADPAMRKWMAKQADFVGAIRLPRSAFGKIADTEVVTDIIVFQKRGPGQVDRSVPFFEVRSLEQGDQAFSVNEYFVEHPENILGKLSYEGSMYRGAEMTVEDTGADLNARVAEIMGQFGTPTDINASSEKQDADMHEPDYQRLAPENVKERAYVVEGGDIYQNVDGALQKVAVSPPIARRFKRMIAVRDAARKLISLQIDPDASDTDIDAARKALNKNYDAFAKGYKAFHEGYNQRLFYEDPDLPLLLALENWNNDTKTATKAKIFGQRTQFPVKEITSADSPSDAIAVSMSEKGRIDVEYVASLLGITADDVADQIRGYAYENPETGMWEPTFLYLSGNVRRKLEAAKAAAELDSKYKPNVEALEAAQPDDIEPINISVRLGAPWITPETYSAFVQHLTGSRMTRFEILPHDGSWVVSGVGTSPKYETRDFKTLDLIAKGMNQKQPKVTWRDKAGKTHVHEERTAAAQAMLDKIRQEFERWIWQDVDRTKALSRIYNNTFNNRVYPQWDGSYLQFPGQSHTVLEGGKLRPHQSNVVSRFLTNGNLLMAHAVGAGKTYAGITMAMEARRIGQAKKPVFVVPNHKIDDWRVDWMRLYPSANILAATKDDFSPKNRQKLMNRIATGDWDGVIVPMSSFEKIPMSPERIQAFFEDQISELDMLIRAQKASRGSDRSILKQLEKSKSALEERLKKMSASWKKDAGPYFDELGIDMLFVDESHAYKNLFFVTKMERISGLQISQTQRSFDMYLKTQFLNETTNYHGVVFATGTPITNTLGEMYTVQRYLQPQVLKEAGVEAFDFWANAFGDTVTDVEVDPTGGGFRVNTKFAKFTNLTELIQMFRGVTDIVTKKQMGIPLPKLKGNGPIVIQSEPTDDVQGYIRSLVSRAEAVWKGGVHPKDDNMLKITNDGRHVALDGRLRVSDAIDHPGSKINKCVEQVKRIYDETAADKGTQVIWCDLSTPGAKKGWSVYHEIKEKLIASGIPQDQIAFIHDANNEKQQASLYLKMNEGSIRVMLASTGKMGTGANVQRRLKAAHHLTAPWVPAEVEQRDGRIERQGNMYDEVEVYQYVTKGTFDAYMWQTLETKAKFIEQAMNGETTAREIEDVSKNSLTFAEVKALASGNPKVLEAIKLDAEVKKLQVLEKAHQAEQLRMREAVHSVLPNDIRIGESTIKHLEKDASRADAAMEKAGSDVDIVIGSTQYTSRKEAAEALALVLDESNKLDQRWKPIGKAYGFDLEVQYYVSMMSERFWTFRLVGDKGQIHYTGQFGDSATGNITRIINTVSGIGEQLAVRKARLTADMKRLADMKEELGKPFDRAEELDQKMEALRRLQAELKSASGPTAPATGADDEAAKKLRNMRRSAGFAGLGMPNLVVPSNQTVTDQPKITFVKGKKDLNPFQKWVLTLSNQARNSRDPLVISAAEDLVDTGLLIQEETDRRIEEGAHHFSTLPREFRKDKGKKFFALMDSELSPAQIDASTVIPDDVKPVLKYFKQADEEVRLDIINQKRAMYRAMYMRLTKEDLLKKASDSGIVFSNPDDVTKGDISDAIARKDVPDDWGRQWSHIQHIYFGQYELKWVDAEGNEHFIGKAETKAEAYTKLMDWWDLYKAAGKDTTGIRLTVDRDFNVPLDAVRLSSGHYFALMSELREALDAERKEIEDATRGIVGQQRSKRKFWGALMRRKGATGFSQDFERVWNASISQHVRWRRLTEMNRRVTPLIEQIRAKGLSRWAEHLEWHRDNLWGRQRSASAQWLDEKLADMPIIGNTIKPYALERLAGMAKSFNYWRHLQTGRFYLINSLQPIQTLWPVTGTRGFLRGVKLYYSKKGRDILKRYGILAQSAMKTSDVSVVRGKRILRRYSPATLSERRNQGLAFLALYDQGLRMGMSEEQAVRWGRMRGQIFTQFANSRADIPRGFNGEAAGLIFQYKRFPIKNLELLSRLAREHRWGGVSKWVLAQLLIGGLSAFLRAASYGTAGYLTYKLYEELKDRFGQDVADTIHHGLPSLVGVDMSGSVSVIDAPFGRNIQEKIGNTFLGPTGQSAVRLYEDLSNTETAKEIGLGGRALKSLVDSSPAIRQFSFLVQALERDTSSYDSKQRRNYELEVVDLWKRAFGFTPETESIQRMQAAAMVSLKYESDKTLDRVALDLVDGNTQKAADRIASWNAQYPEAPMSVNDARARSEGRKQARERTKVERTYDALPNRLKVAFPELSTLPKMSDDDLYQLRWKNTYRTSGWTETEDGRRYHVIGEAHKGKEPLVGAINEELKKRRKQ